MKKRNLSAKKKIHNFFLNKLKNPRIKSIYSEFKKKADILIKEKIFIEWLKDYIDYRLI